MTKQDLLKCIAGTAYNVGFGAKKHFATYDITDKVPSFIGFTSTAVGIFSLFVDSLATKVWSAAFIVLGVLGISISLYDHKKDKYAEAGEELTTLYNRLKQLYYNVKASETTDFGKFEEELKAIEAEYAKVGLADQILFGGWLAHYKFFWEHQIDWVNEQLRFKLFRDKIPLSFTLCVLAALLFLIVQLGLSYFGHP